MTRIVLMVSALLLALGVPAMAETPSKTCVANIQAATRSKRAPKVPLDCWRLGSLKLGMSMMQTRTYLGAPGATSEFTLNYRRRKVAVTRQLYVYPRNLRNWLKLAPARQQDFHPVILKLDFSKGALVAIGLDTEARVTPPPCKPSAAGRAFMRAGMDFPYGLHGMTLGTPISSVTERFGKFAGGNRTQDFHTYLPVPLSVDGKDKVTGFRMASGPPFESGGATPDFVPTLDRRNCFVTGYILKPN